jgi:hypothetical protein
MTQRIFKVHTDTIGRLEACIKKGMYGVSNTAFTREMPRNFLDAQAGDIVFISERAVANNALFGPFYIVEDRSPIVFETRSNMWGKIDTARTPITEIAYWVEIENRKWCLLFDKLLSERISIVWPYNWAALNVNLPPWGLVTGDDADKLLNFAIANEVEASEFFRRHNLC